MCELLQWESLYEVITDASGEKKGFELAHGMGVWEYFARNKKQRDQFARAMTAIDSLGEALGAATRSTNIARGFATTRL